MSLDWDGYTKVYLFKVVFVGYLAIVILEVTKSLH